MRRTFLPGRRRACGARREGYWLSRRFRPERSEARIRCGERGCTCLDRTAVRSYSILSMRGGRTWVLHPENAEPGLFDRRVERGGDRECQRSSRFLRCNDSVVPQPRGSVVRMPLALVLFEDGALELLLLLLAPAAVLRLDAVALDGCEHRRRLLSAHHRDARVRPHPQEARRERAPAHAVVAGAEGAAENDSEFRHAAAGNRGDHLRAVLGDTARLVFFPDHEAGDVLQEHERDVPLAAQLDEVRALQRRLGEQDPVVRDDAYRIAPDARKPRHQRYAVVLL